MELVAKLDDWGKPAWIAAMILGFIVFWPIGLAILGYMIWSGRMGCSMGAGRWRRHGEGNGGSGGPWFGGRGSRMASSGNAAFDEYREETLRRLEEEQKGFVEFLDSLRRAKDKAEFDQYMADRRRRPTTPDAPDAPDAPEGAGPQPQV
ncbi:MAG: DUF2852 domain-containing protein [Inquilinus sp.]|nr:DUF2852 domain-containing protein [Inquilinus sp.]